MKLKHNFPISTHPLAIEVQNYCGTPARAMFAKMLEKAEDPLEKAYKDMLEGWLNGRFGTIVLRDELCWPFKWMFYDPQSPATQEIDWFNAFAYLDSAILDARQALKGCSE